MAADCGRWATEGGHGGLPQRTDDSATLSAVTNNRSTNHHAASSLSSAIPFDPRFHIRLEEPAGELLRLRLSSADGGPLTLSAGLLGALADTAGWLALGRVLALEERPAAASELGVSLINPASGADLIAEPRLLKQGRTLVVFDVDLSEPDGRLVARARLSYPVRQRPASQTTRKP